MRYCYTHPSASRTRWWPPDDLGGCPAFPGPGIQNTFEIPCASLRDLGLRDATDMRIFQEAHDQGAIVMTKDVDFAVLQAQRGAPPKIIWLTCGNTSNAKLREILLAHLTEVLKLLAQGEDLVEIR